MSIAEKAQTVLDLKTLDLPAAPQVISISVEPEEDWTGEAALRVYVILSDETDDESLRGENMIQLKGAIRNRLLEEGIDLFPYVFLRTQTEWREQIGA